jgi:DNA-binding NarL/FixJ family response regulator
MVTGGIASSPQAVIRTVDVSLIISDVITEGRANFLDYASDIRKHFPSIKLIAITTLNDISYIKHARATGIDSFVYKNMSLVELINTIKSTLDDYSTYLKETRTIFNKLNDVETKIIRLSCQGLSRKEISKTLFFSEATIKTYISRILMKTGPTSTDVMQKSVILDIY